MKFKNYGEARKFCEKFGLKLNARDPIYIPYFDIADALLVALNTSPPNMAIQSDAEPCERCKVNATDINNNFCRDCGRQLRR